jgi:hypothetical protein
MNRALLSYNPENDLFRSHPTAAAPNADQALFKESDEMELAAELLDAAAAGELGRFVATAMRRLHRLSGAPVQQAAVLHDLQPRIENTLRQLLPDSIRAPHRPDGADIQATAHTLGLELEGLSPEDMEFEVARQLVRFMTDAARQAATPGIPTDVAARRAIVLAARRYAPGLFAPRRQSMPVRGV